MRVQNMSRKRHGVLITLITLFNSLYAQSCNKVTAVGLADSSVIPSNRIVTSSDLVGNEKDQIRFNCCEGNVGNAWCPDKSDKNPFVEIHLEKSVAIGRIDIQPPSTDNQHYPTDFLKSFDLLFKLSGIDELITAAKDINAIANKTVSLSRISFQPAINTDTIRIVPKTSENMPCFRMELYKCDVTSMCPQNYCQHSGTCSGPNTCICTASYFGEKCQYTKQTIPVTVYKFLSITTTTIITAIHTLNYVGDVTLDTDKSLVVKPGSYITLKDFSAISCFSDLNLCYSGFTITLEFSFSKLDITQTQFVLTNGAGQDPHINGVSLFFNKGELNCYVVTSTQVWIVTKTFTLTELKWYEITISWSPNQGLLVLQDNSLIGSSFKPFTVATPAQIESIFTIGYKTITSMAILHWKAFTIIPLFWEEVKRAGIITDTTTTIASLKTTVTTTATRKTTPAAVALTTSVVPALSTTKSPNTTPGNEIVDYFWNLTSITQTVIVSHGLQLILKGKPTTGVDGVILNGTDQQIEIPNLNNSCLTNPSLCTNGLTIEIKIKLTILEEDTIIFTTGADKPNHPGVTLLYRFGYVHAIVSTTDLSWYVSISGKTILTNDFCNIIVSWSQHTTLKLIINQVLVGESESPIPHSVSTIVTSSSLTIGGGNIHCIISQVHIWHVSVEILTELGLVSCECDEKPETTTVSVTESTVPRTTNKHPATAHATDTTLYEGECPDGCYPSEICFGESTTAPTHAETTGSTPAKPSTSKPSVPPVTEKSTPSLPPVCSDTTTPTPSSAPTTIDTPKPSSPPATEELTTPKPSSPPATEELTTPKPSSPPATEELTTPKPSSPPATEELTTPKPSSPPATEELTTPKPSSPPATEELTTPKCSSPSSCAQTTTPKPSSPPATEELTTPKPSSPPATEELTTPKPSSPPATEELTTPKCSSPSSCAQTTTPKPSSPPATEELTTPKPSSPPATEELTTPKPSSPPATEELTTPKPSSPAATEELTTPRPSSPLVTEELTTPKCSSPSCAQTTTSKPSTPPVTEELTTPKPSSPPATIALTTPTTSLPPSTEELTTPKCSSSACAQSTTPKPSTATSSTETSTNRPTSTESTSPTPVPTTLAPTTTQTTTTTSTTATTTRQPCPEPPSSVSLTPEVNANGQGQLTCSVPQAPQPGTTIKFTWHVEGESTSWTKYIEAPDRSATISVTETHIFLLNKKITCKAEVKFLEVGAEWCGTVGSNVVVPSVKCPPINGTITVVEGREEQNLQVQITVPPSLLCRAEDNGQCRVEVTTTISTDSNELKCSVNEIIPQAVLGVTTVGQARELSCGVAITSGNWQNSVTIPIKATVDGVKDNNRSKKLVITVRVVGQVTLNTDVVNCGDITIVVVDRDEVSTCSSVNDPHIKTFDDIRYNNFIPGEFTLYNHISIPNEVRAVYRPCNARQPRGPTCNCGAAVRSGDDVITFDTCDTRQNTISTKGNSVITVDMYKNGDLTPGTRVLRLGCGQKYEVHLPTGTKVTITATKKPFMNINIQASSYDFERTEGLCGSYNKHGLDDLGGHSIRNPDEFSRLWKHDTTIFKGVAAFRTTARPVYCSCQSRQQPVCRQGLDVYICSSGTISANDITAVLVSQAKTPVLTSQTRTQVNQVQTRVRRDVGETNLPDAPELRDLLLDTEAAKYCKQYLENSPTIKTCLPQLKSDAVNESIRNCAEDLEALNDTDWAVSHVDDLISECLVSALTSVTAWENNDSPDGPSLPAYITDNLCIENCTEHGDCKRGICECHDGWTGETCQIGPTTIPTVLPATQACDLIASSCTDVLIEGDNFVSTRNLTCKIKYITIGNSVTITAEEYTVTARFVSLIQVVCPQTVTFSAKGRSALVTISNDGITYSSNSHIHIVQKSTCQTCNVSDEVQHILCAWKPGSCIIDNQCYARSETYEDDVCYRCDPDVSVDEWTRTKNPNCTGTSEQIEQSPTSSSDDTAIIVLGVLCGVLALAVVGVAIGIFKARASKNAKMNGILERDGSSEVYHRYNTPSTSADLTGQSQAARINAFYNPAMSS